MVADRLGHLWEKAAPWIVAVAAILILALALTTWNNSRVARNLSQENLNSQNNHHAETKAQNAEIKSLLTKLVNDHKATQEEIAYLVSIEKIAQAAGPALTTGQNALIAKLDWLECAVGSSPSACGPKP